jgi:hypothetical protein
MAYKHLIGGQIDYLIVALEVEGLQHGKIFGTSQGFHKSRLKSSRKIRENWNWRELETSLNEK